MRSRCARPDQARCACRCAPPGLVTRISQTCATVLAVADYELLIAEGARGDHTGEWETSLLWAVRPDLVRLDEAGELPGVIGAPPDRASEEQGREGLATAAGRLGAAVERALREDRSEYGDALAAGIRALETLSDLRSAWAVTRRRPCKQRRGSTTVEPCTGAVTPMRRP